MKPSIFRLIYLFHCTSNHSGESPFYQVMEGKPLIESVHEAIFTLYHDPDCHKKNEANRWLIEFQKSMDAWKVADELLDKQTDSDLRYFGAQLIRNKITLSFHELPQEEILLLHSSLMQKLANLNHKTENIILTPLCVAIVDLSLQMSKWNNPIYSFLQKCNEIPPAVLLEILRVFPEEIETEQMRLGANRRKEIQLELSNCAGHLNNYLKLVITRDTSSETLLKAFRCFNSWIPILEDISAVLGCELIPKMFQILTDPPDEMYDRPVNIKSKLHDAASDLMCTVLHGIKSPLFDDVFNMNLISKIADFENAYHISVAREDEEKWYPKCLKHVFQSSIWFHNYSLHYEQNIYTHLIVQLSNLISMNYCRIFSALGEAYLPLMINESKPDIPHYSMRILDLILTCAGHQDYEISVITFHFWFDLGELLYQKHDDAISSLFKPFVSRLLVALARQVQMEPDHEGLLEENDDFKEFREKVCDLVRDLVFVVGSTNTFCQIFLNMQNSSSLTWDQIEANLFIMYAVAWKMSLNENEVIPKTVESILSLPESTHIAVKYTAILILGELREWFDEHPNYLIATLEYLASNLQHPELSDAAAQSMCGICHEAKQKLRDLFAPLSNILKNLHTYKLSNKSAIAVIKGVMAVMSNLPSAEISIAMKEICWLQAFPLQKIVETRETEAAVVNCSQNDPVIWLDRLAAVFRFIDQKDSALLSELCLPAFSEVQPVLFRVMDHYQSNVAVMERCCRCIRFAIRVLGKHGVFALPSLAEKLVELYCVNGHSCFLYLGSILVDEYGNDSSNWDVILRMIHAFVEPTCALLPDENSFRDHPDTIEDLFRLCSRTLQRLPIVFLRSASIWPLLERGLAAVYLDHREANSSVMKFFHELFDCSKTNDSTFDAVKKEAVRQIFEKHGEPLVYHLIHASVFKLPSYTLVNVAEVLYDLLLFDLNVTMKWIKLSVEKLPNQNSYGSLMASPEQVEIFLKSCEVASKTKDISKSLRDFTLYYS